MLNDPTRDDISFLRSVSESARLAPLLSGTHLVLWGTVIALCAFGQYLIVSRILAVGYATLPVMWGVAMGMTFAVSRWLRGRISTQPGAGAYNNRVDGWVWRGMQWGIISYAACALISATALDGSFILFDTILGVAFAGYGAAFYVTARTAEVKWLDRISIIAFVGAGAVPLMAGAPEFYLMATLIVLGISVVPGVILIRQQPAEDRVEDNDARV